MTDKRRYLDEAGMAEYHEALMSAIASGGPEGYPDIESITQSPYQLISNSPAAALGPSVTILKNADSTPVYVLGKIEGLILSSVKQIDSYEDANGLILASVHGIRFLPNILPADTDSYVYPAGHAKCSDGMVYPVYLVNLSLSNGLALSIGHIQGELVNGNKRMVVGLLTSSNTASCSIFIDCDLSRPIFDLKRANL